ncbi:phosphofructokinase [Spirochaetia bacterium]|nr:phosphofructokinase [Spirochaetia bacterium]
MGVRSCLSVCMSPTLQKTLCFPGIAPGMVNRTAAHRLDAAGKGINVSRVLTQLAKPNLHLTQLGGSLRPLFLELCAADGLAIQWVESNSPIRFCYTLITGEDSGRTVTELVEEAAPVGPGTEDRLMAAYVAALPDQDMVVISGSKAAGFSDALIPGMVREAKEAGSKVVLDIRGRDLLGSLAFSPDIIKPNLLEFALTFAPELLSGNELIDDTGRVKGRIRDICGELWDKHHSRVVLTRGGEGIWFADGEGLHEYPVEPMRAVNTTGSGDAFTAGLAAAFGDGASLQDAVAEGARCGRLNAGLLRIGSIR